MFTLLFGCLLLAGIYRWYDGCKRLKRAEETSRDERWRSIPDAEVIAWWHRLTVLDRHFGVFFKYYGLFLIIISFLNLLLNLKTEVEIPLNGFTILFGFCITVALIVGWVIMGENSGRSKRSSFSSVPAGYAHFPLDFSSQKDSFYLKYSEQMFREKKDWQDLKGFSHSDPAMYYPITTIIGNLDGYLKGVSHVKFGAWVYYGSWLLSVLTITAYHFYVFF